MIIKKPLISEKTLLNYKNNNVVTFEVSLETNKYEAIKTLEKLFNVKVEDVKVVNRLGKIKYNRLSRKSSRTSNKKIMMFTLKKGDKIDLFNE